MKRIFSLIFLVSIIQEKIQAQSYQLDFSYQYMAAKQWDLAVQSYNFSRPFNEQKQALLAHGISSNFSYLFKNNRKLKHGLSLSYSFTRSNALNENLDNSLHLNLMQLSYLLQYQFSGKTEGLDISFQAGGMASALFRRVNGEPLLEDDTRIKAFGTGIGLKISSAYSFSLSEKIGLGPFLAFGYSPFFFSPNTEAVLNQTKGLSSKRYTQIAYGQLGVRLNFN